MTSPVRKDALILVDIQNDFLPPSGALAVADGRSILPVVKRLINRSEGWSIICASLDSHPVGHVSFASSHNGKRPFETTCVPTGEEGEDVGSIEQMLWPDHCIDDTHGWRLESSLQTLLDEKQKNGMQIEYVHKGTCKHVDAYSAFSDNHYSHFTPLARLLFENRITNLTIVGLALDYCVRYTVLDARKFGLEVEVWRAGTKAVDAAAEEKVLGEFRRKGVEVRE